MNLKVFKSDGTLSREENFEIGVPLEGEKGLQAAKETIVALMANRRQGTRCTKTRGAVSGGGKKPWRQKGTGRARAGSIRSPLWVGGGVVFGPTPRDFSKKVNAQVKLLALSRVLHDRANAGDLVLIEQFDPSLTKSALIAKLATLISPVGSLLFVDSPFSAKLLRSARNVERLQLRAATSVNAIDLAQSNKIVFSITALNTVLKRFDQNTKS